LKQLLWVIFHSPCELFYADDPSEIPENQRIRLIRKGKKVHTGKFGNEGSGGQSYLRYNWKANITYKFLLKAIPTDNNSTTYTAWFSSEEDNQWRLIASFERPQTTTYLTRLHSFLENFITEQGNIIREATYKNQWIIDNQGKWHELTKAMFTADNTARKKSRLDYAGGSNSDGFYLKNCGFFQPKTKIGYTLERKNNSKPTIDISILP
jgi:hypothetical protein